MKRAFVTGGSGFLGGRLVPALVARGVEVRALARSDASARKVEALGAVSVRGDLVTGPLDMAGCDACFHAGAVVEEHASYAQQYEANVTGTERVMVAAKAAGIATIVHVGTEAVLADGKPIVRADETRPRPIHAVGPYPRTKGLAEAAATAAGAVVIRPRFIWGNGDTSLMPQIAAAVAHGKFAWVSGGHYLTSTCHVANVVEGALLAADKGKPGEIYFLTDGEPVEFRAFLTQLLATQRVDPGTRSVPRWLAWTAAYATSWMKTPPVSKAALALMGHEVTVDDRKARRELGYAGKVTIEQGLAEMRA